MTKNGPLRRVNPAAGLPLLRLVRVLLGRVAVVVRRRRRRRHRRLAVHPELRRRRELLRRTTISLSETPHIIIVWW